MGIQPSKLAGSERAEITVGRSERGETVIGVRDVVTFVIDSSPSYKQ